MAYLEPPTYGRKSVPPPPPKIDLKLLWGSLLLPPGVTFLTMAGMIVFLRDANSEIDWFSLSLTICFFSTLTGWVMFILCISKRYRGSSYVLLLLAYPILEGVVAGAIFFVGCLTFALGTWEGKRPPEEKAVIEPAPSTPVLNGESGFVTRC